jgi:hypothetical protein
VTTHKQYIQRGWRAAFLFGGTLAFAFLLFYRTVPELEVWMESEKNEAPLKEVFSGHHGRNLLRVFMRHQPGCPGGIQPSPGTWVSSPSISRT